MERSPIKLALVGTCCVGKTTLYNESQTQLPSAIFVEEAARQYFASKKTSVNHGFIAQWGIQTLALVNEQRVHQQNPRTIVCDRSVIDAAVYSKVAGDINGSNLLLNRVRFWIPSYSKIYLLDPKDVPYETDEVRTETPQMRDQLHQGFLDLFHENGIPFEVLSGSLEQRVSIVQHFTKT